MIDWDKLRTFHANSEAQKVVRLFGLAERQTKMKAANHD